VGSARDLLHEDEELLVEARPHPVAVLAPALVLVVAAGGAVTIALRYPGAPVAVAWLLVAMVALPALWTGVRVLRWRSSRLFVTTRRLLSQRGVLGRDVVQLRLQRIAEVHCSQSLAQRLIGTGRLVFEVAGGAEQLAVEDVRRPRRLQRVITAQLDRLDILYGPSDAGLGARGYAPRARMHPSTLVAGRASSGGGTTLDQSARPRWTDTPPHGVALGAGDARSVPGQILQLDELRRRGLLSDDEFAAKKAELLGRL
jgi:membrane protein YdbS with pleckstrin-like domain